jgi:membrane dipeptidase
MPLRSGDIAFLPQLERVRGSGISVISLNVSFDILDPHEAFLMLATFRHWIRQNSDKYVLAESVADVVAAKASGKLAVIFDIEGGNAVAAHPGLVEIFYRLGVRWMLLAYNKSNKLGGGCMEEDEGLTCYGREIIDEMEKVGMILCCSHMGHRTALEAIDYSKAPVIFSHSNPSRVHQHTRNISDDLLKACARSGGVVNINGVGIFLGSGASGSGDGSTETLLRHIDYVAQLVGARHVGLGLDYIFDMAELEEYLANHPEVFPAGLQDTDGYAQVEPERFPEIAEGLLRLGYSDADVQGIMGENNLRVATAVWK